MNNYLYQHYKGKYRVLADYDLDTNDFPRDESGAIDPDFNDFYMPGKKGVQIRHAGGDVLGCYAFGTGMGNNLLRAIYKKELNKEPPAKSETVAKKLIDKNIILDVTYYDGELLFTFKAKHIDDWANIFKLRTSGANISPLSPKNLPKSDYKIPKKDEDAYAALFPADMVPLDKARISKKTMQHMVSKLNKKQQTEMKKLGMKPKQYIHYIGKWQTLLDITKKEIDNE